MTLEAKVEEILVPCIGKVKPQIYDKMIHALVAVLTPSSVSVSIDSDPNFRIENWPLHDVLFQMAKWLKHLNDTHDCDCHGWEARSFLISAALQYQDQALDVGASASPHDYAKHIIGSIFDNTAASYQTLKHLMFERIVSAEISRRVSWKLTHERDAELLKRDGWMCEQHPGKEFPHDDCAGPGMPWIVEGKEAISGLIFSR